MTREYSPLTLAPLTPGSRISDATPPRRVTLDDPAIAVMTDLQHVSVASTTPEEPIEEAHAMMIRRGVRLLFVLDSGGAVQGVITATDLLGEKPMRFMQDRRIPHSEIRVADIMTPATQLEAIALYPIEGRLARFFLAAARAKAPGSEEGRITIELPISQSELALLIGASRPKVNTALSMLESSGALERNGSKIVCDIEELQAIAGAE